ncbi:neutral alpha-glucosidase AB [Dendroctonus ponderosae]|uniref:Glucosidase II subunit alpha n=1 Tax=Dendroctonus ponderosae TaxID=77166 RepID=U4USB7_DENPD|nr:neutral alpha-glucosidase AB [Dendroctonus ponderosae]ERL92990.1 hypothetical protein D910_10293 [Dendroctonus ponderosae]KAH1010929.1 hypothetical protein HUJ05_005154 [Dendroctonus ponderosae]
MTKGVFLAGLVLLAATSTTLAVDKNNFKTCEQSSFCRRLRKYEEGASPYRLDFTNVKKEGSTIEFGLINKEFPTVQLKLVLQGISHDIFRVTVDEVNGLYHRYIPRVALNGDPEPATLTIQEQTDNSMTVKAESQKVVITADPLKLEFYYGDEVQTVVNARGLFAFEHYRNKPADGEVDVQIKDDPGAWEENFKSHHDSKPRGPSAIAADFTFPGAVRAYGLPEHADRLSLRTTGKGGLDPYRLYNLDVFEYELDSTMALYGAVPLVYAHSLKHTAGVFWHNAAETWVDVNNSKDANVVSSLVNLVSGSKNEAKVDVRFMSESGVMDFFVIVAANPGEVTRMYSYLTGSHNLPQLFALGYHQSRWNYNDQDDVTNVVANFDAHNLPVDVMWLDIEYTNGKKYFTWDPVKFSNPQEMVNNLTSTGRKLVVIIDPHIKRESGYFVHEDALEKDLYVKNKDGSVYEGWCWPGSSSYLDFYKPEASEYYKNAYSVEVFKGTSDNVWLWNDMNEPSVFNGPEVTMPKDLIHYGDWEHRDIHNEYPLAHIRDTYHGLLSRSPNLRPFILTRGHFSGSQRFAAMWTGDNDAKWSHLAISLPMCLSEALGGISFCGADVGGFFNNPDLELLQRWYQAAIWLPFFRAHAHIDTRRREPYLFNDDVVNRIRTALRLRYAHLPLWYTLFYEHETTKDAVIRPLIYEFSSDEKVLDIDNTVLLGDSILARPVTESGVSSVEVYLPGKVDSRWYNLEDFRLYLAGSHNIPVTLDSHVVFYKGGSIIPRKDRPRRSSTVMHNDPFTLYVALDQYQTASGTLYVDDYQSFNYRDNKSLYIIMRFESNKLTLKRHKLSGKHTTKEWVERVVILGPPAGVTGANLQSKSLGVQRLETSYDKELRYLTIRKPGVSVMENFTIELLF